MMLQKEKNCTNSDDNSIGLITIVNRSNFINFIYYSPSFIIGIIYLLIVIQIIRGEELLSPTNTIIFLVFICLNTLRGFYKKILYKATGAIQLSISELKISTNNIESLNFSINEIDRLIVNYKNYSKWVFSRTIYKTDGMGNKLEILVKGKSYSFEFLLENKKKYLKLKEILLNLYVIGQKVEYYDNGELSVP